MPCYMNIIIVCGSALTDIMSHFITGCASKMNYCLTYGNCYTHSRDVPSFDGTWHAYHSDCYLLV